ncbi:hypothetical protein [Burkholderia cenocepacia]|uniref:hypothetical protein n=1 Tax=Burkholderia cenocepacia TaxID=95486 RepID=UPI0026527C86|nr:hypothetical protein [Burkholderia cenocepacia]MDN7540243.1 hypothetical protein [Burkholderia cenocepacia]
MALIELTGKYAVGNHRYAIVDDDMVDYLSQWRWKAKPNGGRNNVYAVRNAMYAGKHVTIRMHRVVADLGFDDPREVDHDNHNSLDNRRVNLVPATRSENALNARRITHCLTCKQCGQSYIREVSAMVSPERMVCGDCRRRNQSEPRRSSIFIATCAHCGVQFTARTSLRKFCGEACRCRARYARSRANGSPI